MSTEVRSDGLRDALKLLNAVRASVTDEGEPPFHLATNTLLLEIARREGRSLRDILAEVREAG